MFSYYHLSIILLLVNCHPIEFSDQLLDLFVDVLDVFAISLVLSIFVLFLIGFSVFVAELAFNFTTFLALFVGQSLTNRRDSSRDSFFVF